MDWIDMSDQEKLKEDPITYFVEMILDLKRQYGEDERLEKLKNYIEKD